jgi:hypothetical protein
MPDLLHHSPPLAFYEAKQEPDSVERTAFPKPRGQVRFLPGALRLVWAISAYMHEFFQAARCNPIRRAWRSSRQRLAVLIDGRENTDELGVTLPGTRLGGKK